MIVADYYSLESNLMIYVHLNSRKNVSLLYGH